jgi:hypothetical protein
MVEEKEEEERTSEDRADLAFILSFPHPRLSDAYLHHYERACRVREIRAPRHCAWGAFASPARSLAPSNLGCLGGQKMWNFRVLDPLHRPPRRILLK